VLGARASRPRPRHLPAPTGSSRERLLALTGALLSHEPPTVVGPVDAPEAADALLDFLARNGYLSEARTGWALS
jgi:electron transfer flavoprotein beta subunit